MRRTHPAAHALRMPALALLLATQLPAVVISTSFVRSTEAEIEVSGILVEQQQQTSPNGPATSSVTSGTPLSENEARARGTSEQLSMVSNAEYDIRDFNFQNPVDFTSVNSQASIDIEGTSLTGGDITIDFFIPPSFLELRTNAEAAGGPFTQSARMRADLTLCAPDCTTGIGRLLAFEAELTGDYFNQTFSSFALSELLGPFPFGGPPSSLDLTPLLDDTLTVVDSMPNFLPLRTITWNLPAYRGSINIGSLPVGQRFVLIYDLETEVIGNTPLSGAAAAINDPLNIMQFGMPLVDQAGSVPPPDIPEPSTGLLVLTAIGLVAARRRSRR